MHLFLKKQLTLFCILAPTGALFSQTSEIDFNTPIDYTTALSIAVERSPQLDGFQAILEAAEGKIIQADLRPNPVISGEVENVLGTGPQRDVQGMELTLGIRQLIETADKRAKRTSLAEKERDLVTWQRERALAKIESEAREAFVAVLLAEKLVTLREDQIELAERSGEETEKMMKAARLPEVDLTRSNLEIQRQRFALEQARRNLTAARNALATIWGVAPAPVFRVAGEVKIEGNLPAFHELIAALSGTATLAQYDAVRVSREAALDLERAKAKPDFEVFAGGRYFNENDGDLGFVMGVEIPWPVFDQNQGNIQAARAGLRLVEAERESTRRALLSQLSQHYQVLASAHADALSVQAELLPAAEQTLADTEAGYKRGQFRQLAVLESRNTLFEIRETYLESLVRYAQAQARISALTRPSTINSIN